MALCFLLLSVMSLAQETFLSNNTADERSTTYAFVNAKLVIDPATVIENGTLLIKGDKILQAGRGVSVPANAIQVDLEGKYVYPGFIDLYTNYGLPKVEEVRRAFGETPQFESKVPQTVGWNEHNQAHYNAISEFKVDTKAAESFREMGFTSVLSFRPDGVLRGTSVMTNLSDGPVQESILKEKASQHFAFRRGASKQLYPNSIMGMVALIRQNYLDAQWYQDGNAEQFNLTLERFNGNRGLPQIIEANSNKLRVLLADKIGDEFGVQYIIKGNGDEYQRLDEVVATRASLILPLNFPDAYDVDDPLDAADVSLAMLKHWEMAPANPKLLGEKGVRFAFTSANSKNAKSFWSQVRKAVKYGLAKEDALASLTTIPASMIGVSGQVGSLKTGKDANFIVADDDLFQSGRVIETWVEGARYEVNEGVDEELTGTYDLTVGSGAYNLEINSSGGKLTAKVKKDTVKVKSTFKVAGARISLTLQDGDTGYRLSGWKSAAGLRGSGDDQDGENVNWVASRTGDVTGPGEDQMEQEPVEYGDIIYPFVAFGLKTNPRQETVLFRNATVWTMEDGDAPATMDVLVRDGKIAEVGTDLSAEGAREVDGTGMHLTPGIIDEHSHAALSGVNESSQSMVSEVRMYDAIDSEDIDIYRQLAGGVVAAQLLHGSANPVGGQSALVKFRWGASPEEMKIEGADGFIKFALGENVKQSNRSSEWVNRFPQTRMGVEQVFVDGFTRAKDYGAKWTAYNNLPRKEKATAKAPRRDLQLEALQEIIEKDRFISCHSYVQSEINMLMKVAESFDFRVNTFTHILEGYKVADKMAAHGAGGSTFADWWAYKYEVKDAIPYNAVLMTQAGVVSAINSDDSEMARRLNQEAAKSVKYGEMSEWDALKLITINPAKLLHLEERMGSIKAGKEADLVLWTDHPLSIYARAEITMVDGIIYYSRETDNESRAAVAQERTRLIGKMRNFKANGGKTQKAKKPEKHDWHCEDFVISDFVTGTEE